MAPRLIRRQPLHQRITAYLDPVDFLLTLSEKLNSGDWDQWQKTWALPIALALNLVFLVARANSGQGLQASGDGVFGDDADYPRVTSLLVRALGGTLSTVMS